MNVLNPLRKGWCPSALRPMETGDGWLMRFKPRAGTMTVSSLVTVSDIADQFGSGDIELTNRGNIQLRGLTPETHSRAVERLIETSLAERDAEQGLTRNVVVDPLAGLHARHIDVRDLALDLEALLAADAGPDALPAKFGFELRGRAGYAGGGAPADVTLSAIPQGFAVELQGDTNIAAVVSAATAAPAAKRLAIAFLDLNRVEPSVRRMQDAVRIYGAQTLFENAGLVAEKTPFDESRIPDLTAGTIADDTGTIGVAIGLPFGRISADVMTRLAETALAAGCNDVRVTARRLVVFPLACAQRGRAFLATASELGLIVSEADARLKAAACPGAPSCANATTATRADASRLIDAFSAAGLQCPSIHISGCSKGCARKAAAQLTLVARHGAYDFIRDGAVEGAVIATEINPLQIAEAALHIFPKGAA